MGIVEVPLTRGKFACIDEEDAARVLAYKWRAKLRWGIWYACRTDASVRPARTEGMHRLILNAPDGIDVDHINGDGLDNRRCNLRLANDSQNGANRKIGRNNTSGFKGVSFSQKAKKWQAGIQHFGRSYHLGFFDNAADAAKAYDDRAREIFGEFARTNFREEP